MSDFIPSHFTFKQLFIENSNAIDPQPGFKGDVPGCPMFDNHLAALEFVLDSNVQLNSNTPLDIHRILTKKIPYFEDNRASGLYRTCDVYIGNHKCPSPFIIEDLMNQWYSLTKELIESGTNPVTSAWISHHMFEVIHPFIDGNGRTGRLILNKILVDLKQEPIIVMYANRYSYYDAINLFRNRHFFNSKFVDLEEYLGT